MSFAHAYRVCRPSMGSPRVRIACVACCAACFCCPKSAENRRLLLIFTRNVHFQRSEIGGLSLFNSSVHQRFFEFKRTSNPATSCSDIFRFAQRTLADCTRFSVRATRRNFKKFAILSRDLAQNCHDVDAGHALLYAVRQQRRQLLVRMCVSIAVAA